MALFLVHYLNRTFVYPLQIRGGKPTPFSVFGLAFFFCILNGHLQMRNLASIQAYDESWFVDPRFGIGLFIFFTGMFINLESDHILRNLRR
jgi:3-oxo-5-alpha-steroid 4-dehydrogenase 1